MTGPMVEKPKAVILILTKPKLHSGGSFEPAGNEVFPDDADDVVFDKITSATSGPPCLRLRDDPWKKERREDVNCC